jgi:hypothetical protein
MSAQIASQEYQETTQDIVLDAEDEMMKMLESALGPMTALLDKKFKQKMSQHALMKVVKGVVSITLKTVDAETPENEKKVLAAIEESGISGKKEKRAGKLSGYTLFTKQMHQDKKEEFKAKGLKGTDVTKEIGALWKALPKEEQQEYNDKAKKENDENPSGSRKTSRKGSKKGSSKSDKETHKCCFVISKGERKGETCGTTVRSDEPTFEGQWLCSKHTTAEKKKAESNKKDKKEKSSKKKDKDSEEEKPKKKKAEKEEEDEEEEEKPKKKAVKKVEKKKVEEDEEEEKPSKKSEKKKTEKKIEKKKEEEDEEEEEKPKKKTEKKIEKKTEKKVQDEDEIEDLDEDKEESTYQILDEMCVSWEEDIEGAVVNAKMTKTSLEKLIGKKLTQKEYDVKLSATNSSLIVKYEEDDEEEMKAIKKDKMTESVSKVHEYIRSFDE